MSFSSIKVSELVQQTENMSVNLFNLLSLVEHKTNVPLNADWQIFKENDDTVLLEKIFKEYGTNTSLQNVFDYLLACESTYSNLLSSYLTQYRAQNKSNDSNLFHKHGYNLKNLKQQSCLHRE